MKIPRYDRNDIGGGRPNDSECWPLFHGVYGSAVESSRLCRSGDVAGGFGAGDETAAHIDGAVQMAATGKRER